ncbi:hypothetical protein GCM10028817_09010 [Spirosoma pomorum]
MAYCQGTTGVPPLTATGQNLKWYTGSTGGTAFTAITPSTSTVGQTTYYVSQTINGCEGPRATLTVTVNPLPAIPTVISSISYCQNATASSLAAAVTSGSNLRWYTSATGGTGSTVAPSPATTSIGSTSYYVSQINTNGCESDRAVVTVTIRASPSAPTVITPVTYCQGITATPLSATPVSGGTLNWFSPSNNALGSTAPTPSTTNPGTTFYQVSQTVNGCESPRIQITVTINATPPAPVTSPANACQGGATISLVNSVTATGTLKWYTSPTSASLAAAPQVATNTTGSQVFYVSQTNANGCESSRAAVTYTVNARPAAPAVSASPVVYCQNSTAVPLTATPAAGATLTYYTVASGGTPYQSLTPSTTASNSYYVSQTLNGCESQQRSVINVVINALPARPAVTTPVTYCQFTVATPLSATPTTNNTLNWYGTNQTGGTASTVAPTPPTTAGGTFTYYVSQEDPIGCESERAAISVVVSPKPNAPTVTPATACLNSAPVSLAQSVTASGTLKWYTAATGGTGSTVAPVPPTSTIGSTTYYVSQTNGSGCESDRSAITFTVNPLPAAPVPTVRTVFYCQGATATPLTATGQNLRWYTSATGGTPTTTLTPSTTTAGNVTYYVSQTNADGCESSRESVTVTVGPRPAAPAVISPITYCQNVVASSLTATAVSTNTLRWYTNPTGGTGSPTPPTVSTSAPGTFTYYVSQTSAEGCESERAILTVTVSPTPAAPLVSSTPVIYCQGATASPLTATATVPNGTLNWYTQAIGGVASSVAPTPSTAESEPPTRYYFVSQSINGCEGPRATIAVTIRPAVTVSIVGLPGRVGQCATPITLVGSPAGGTFTIDGNPATQLVPGALSAGSHNVVYQYVGAGGCTATATSSVSVDPLPVATLVNSGPLSCTNATVALAAGEDRGGVTFRFSAGATQLSTRSLATVQTAGVYSVTVTDNNGCSSVASTTVISDQAAPVADLTNDGPLSCTKTSVLLTASGGGTYRFSTGATQIGGSSTASVITAGIYSVTVIGANGCLATASTQVAGNQSAPVAGLINDGPLSCTKTSVTLTASGSGTYQFSAGAIQVGAGPTATVTSTGVYSVTVVGANGCTSVASTTVVGDQSLPVAGLTNDGPLSCTKTSVLLTASGSGTYQFSAGATQVGAGPTATVATAGVYSVTVTGSNGCSSIASTTVVGDQSVPVAGLTNDGPLSCTKTSVTLTASGAGTYRFSAGATSINGGTTASVTTAGVYSVTVVGSNGCTSVASTTVVGDQSLPTVNLASSGPLACNAGTATLTATSNTPGASYRFSAGANQVNSGNTATVSTAGVYSVTATAPNGCFAVASTTVTAAACNFAISGVTTVSCVVVDAAQGQRQITFVPQYTGLTGQPVIFSVANELAPTTAVGPYTLRLYSDNPVITLIAQQGGVSNRFSYNWLAACGGSVEPPANTPPTVVGVIPAQTATVGQPFSYVIPAGTFSDAQTPTQLVLNVAGLPAGLSFTAPATISGTPSVSGISTVQVIASDPGGLSASTSFQLTVTGGTVTPPAGFAISGVTTVSCVVVGGQRQVTFVPQYTDLTGQPVTFSVANELAPTTAAGPYTLRLYSDNPTIILVAQQGGMSSTFNYNWLSACSGSVEPPRNTSPTVVAVIPAQAATVGQPFSYVIPAGTFSDAQTPTQLVLSVAGLPAGLIFTAPATISGVATVTGVSTVQVTATDPGGLSASTSFQLTVTGSTVTPPAGFAISGVTTVSCVVVGGQRQVTFLPQYTGLTGQPVTFSVANELSPTTAAGPYTLRLYSDNPVISLVAQQGGMSSTFNYNWLSACGASQGRIGVLTESTLQVKVLGNPIEGDELAVEVSGAAGQRLSLDVVDERGYPAANSVDVSVAQSLERVVLRVSGASGMYLLRVSTPTQRQTVKVLKAH